MGTRVSASLPCAGPGLSPRSSVVVLVAGPGGGGYWETTETGTTYRGIGSLAYRPATWTQRVARLHPRRTTWTLVVTGPTVRMWGFFHAVGLGGILTSRPQGSVLRQCRIGRESPPRSGQPHHVSGAAPSRLRTRPLPALSDRPPAQHRLRSATGVCFNRVARVVLARTDRRTVEAVHSPSRATRLRVRRARARRTRDAAGVSEVVNVA